MKRTSVKEAAMDLILFCGQSNMQGQTECLTECLPVEGGWEYRFLEDALVPLKNPVGENIRFDLSCGYPPFEGSVGLETWLNEHAMGSACYGNTNLVPEFCRAYIRETGRSVAAISAAKGSTCVEQWIPGTGAYEVLKTKMLAALRKVGEIQEPGHIYAVWLQGESDAIAGTEKEIYKQRLTCLKDALKADVGLERFCIIRVGHFTNDQRDLKIMTAQDEICMEDSDFLMLTRITTELNEQPEYMNPYVAGHYSARGMELLGKTAGKALGRETANRNIRG